MGFVSWVKHGLLKQPKPTPPPHTNFADALTDYYCLGRADSGHNTYLDVKKNLSKDEWSYIGSQCKELSKELSRGV